MSVCSAEAEKNSGTAGGTEVITQVQFELPQEWTLSGQPAAGTAGDAVWTVTGSGTTADPYVIEFTAGSEANRELALGQFTLTPPAHSSKDATVQLSITTVDSNADVTGGADTSDEVTVQKPVQQTLRETSSWLRVTREAAAKREMAP